MTLKSVLAALCLVLGLLLGPASAAQMECPAASRQMDDIIASLKAAKGCDAAMKVFEACEYTASGDVQFGEVVEKNLQPAGWWGGRIPAGEAKAVRNGSAAVTARDAVSSRSLPLASGQAVRRLALDEEILGSNPSSPASSPTL